MLIKKHRGSKFEKYNLGKIVEVVEKIINDYTRELKLILTWEEVQPNFNKAAKAFSKKIKMPGFRPGKIPMR